MPRDVKMLGFVLDRSHEKHVGELIRKTRSANAVTLLGAWRRSNYPFCIVAGCLHVADGPVLGGFAGDWGSALDLFRHALGRFDTLAGRGSFLSAWLCFLTPERREQVHATIAEVQQTEGNA